MSSRGRSGDTLGDLLAERRKCRFVGRAGEIELFRAAVGNAEPDFRVLHVHGPGGIGKTTLLEVLADVAAEAGATVVRVDARETVPAPSVVLETITAALPSPDASSVALRDERLVLLIDTYERLTPIDDWVREQLLPGLSATARTVIAGRAPPGPAWRSDPAWRDLLRVVSLRNLDPAESREYLTACGVAPGLHDELITRTRGHPLGLSLFADVVVRSGEVGELALTPDLVGDLVRGFVDVVPDELQRRVLAVCALARVTTASLLSDVLAGDPSADPHVLFRWLQELSFVEAAPDGQFPHDLAREVLDADLRWRDPEEYTAIFRRVAEHLHGRLRSLGGRDQQRAISDLKFLFRNLPSVLSPADWDTWGQHYPERAAAADRSAALGMIAAAEGDASARIAARWWETQPGAFHVVRGDDDAVRGVIVLLDLTAASDDERSSDPGTRAVWRHAHATAPPRPGELVTQTRFVVDRDAYQGPSPTLNAVPIVTLQHQLASPQLAWDYITLHEPDRWDTFFALADAPRVASADFEVAGRRYGVFAHDYRVVPIDQLIHLWTERALTQDPALQLTPAPQPAVLSHAEFTEAVRQALRDLTRPDLLARNPLLATRLLHDRAEVDPPDATTLQRLLDAAVDTLRAHPRDDKLLRAVERTYVHPAPTQEAAAARLGLPFSTYRRHLTQGVGRIVSWLWDQEVYGPDRRGPTAVARSSA